MQPIQTQPMPLYGGPSERSETTMVVANNEFGVDDGNVGAVACLTVDSEQFRFKNQKLRANTASIVPINCKSVGISASLERRNH